MTKDAPLIIHSEEVLGSLIKMPEVIDLMREAFKARAEGDLISPPRVPVAVGQGTLVFTTGAVSTETRNVLGFRAYYRELHSRDYPGELTAVFHAASGTLKGIVMGTALGQWRTGAIGGLAIDSLVPINVENLGILGTGAQAKAQLLAALCVRDFKRVYVYSRSSENRQSFARSIEALTGRSIEIASHAQPLVESADVLICATSSTEPVFDADWLKPRVHINNIGPKLANSCELPLPAYEQADLLVTDSPAQLVALAGDFVLVNCAEIVGLSSLVTLPQRDSRRSVFISLGLAGTEVFLADELIRRQQIARADIDR